LDITVQDRSGLWRGAYYPKETSEGGAGIAGIVLQAIIHTENWFEQGDYYQLDCGKFEIDSCDYSGPPDVMSIKAVSTPLSSSMRREEKSKAWEDVTLQKIAQDIAGEAGLQLIYEVSDPIKLDRVDQLQKSDMAFLQELCNEHGVALKVTNEKVVLFDEAAYESRDVVDIFYKSETIGIGNPHGRIKSYKFVQDTSDTVSSAEVSYKDPKSGKLCKAEYTLPNPPATGQKAKINERPPDLKGDKYRDALSGGGTAGSGRTTDDYVKYEDTTPDFNDIRADITPGAERQAKAEARNHNKGEWTCDITLIGNTLMVGGVNVQVNGWGVYSGKYSVDTATHKLGGGYEVGIKAHRCLKGY